MLMLSDKELKKRFKVESSQYPQKYYPVKALEDLDFKRYKCKNCRIYFWSRHERAVCGEPECVGGYSFFDNKLKNMSFTDVWTKFSKLLTKKGYKPVHRYPVVARWNPTTDFTIASVLKPFVGKSRKCNFLHLWDMTSNISSISGLKKISPPLRLIHDK